MTLTNDRVRLVTGSAIAVIVALGLAGVVTYTFPGSGQVSTSQNNSGVVVQCGFVTTCTANNPLGLDLSMAINTTSVPSNGSLTLMMSLVNPTSHYINFSKANNWYLPALSSVGALYCSAAPYAMLVFRGYYTLQNVSSGTNVLLPGTPMLCLRPPSVTSYSIPPQSVLASPSLLSSSFLGIYAINGGTVKDGNISLSVDSLWSDKPAVYTIALGDEWGDLALMNFSVVPA